MSEQPNPSKIQPKKKGNTANLTNAGKGRPKGVPNKLTATLRDIARRHTDDAIKVLVEIALKGETDASRVSAANSILDRGYGKPSQVLSGDEDGGAIKAIHEIVLRGVMPK